MVLGDRLNVLNWSETATTWLGMWRGSWQWSTGVSGWGRQDGGIPKVARSTEKLEGVEEGMLAELAEDMLLFEEQ